MSESNVKRCKNGHHHEHGECCGKKGHKHGRGAKTFRRRRAIAFWEILDQKRATLKKQLETPELQAINPVLVGELKALDMVMDEFVRVFELHEVEEKEQNTAEVPSENSEETSEDHSANEIGNTDNNEN